MPQKEFSEPIINSINEIKVPDEAAITAMVNEAVTNSLKNLPENFTQAISNATKDAVTKEDLETALKDSLKKEDFKNEMKEFTNNIINKVGNKSEEVTDKEEVAKGRKNQKSFFRLHSRLLEKLKFFKIINF